ncbi:MAG: aspartyl protease family protein [Candidatus Hydrogenedentales bacterium]
MSQSGVADVGRVTIEFDLANYDDVRAAQKGEMDPTQVRRVRLSGIVDTGAARLVLPEAVVDQLGLPTAGEITVRYADQRTAKRRQVRDAWIEYAGRGGVFSAVVEPKRTDALVGAIVLEELDLIVDCTRQTLIPRDPNTIISEIE